jgi:hypothetical protein
MFHVHGFASLALLAQPQPSFQLPQFCQLTYRHLHASSFGKQTMEQSTNTFLYRPLQTSPQELRLVFIQPGSFFSPINCVLKHEFLKDEPFFEALSYVWGNAQETVPILLNGHVFNLTTNLEFALQHLRLEEGVRTFWIDAICINQLGVEERNQQVRSMGEFYKAAQQTIVWLGPEAEHIALAFQYILERDHVAQTQSLK